RLSTRPTGGTSPPGVGRPALALGSALVAPGKSSRARLRERLHIRLHPSCAVVHRVGACSALACCALLVERHTVRHGCGPCVRDPDRVATEAATALSALAAGGPGSAAARWLKAHRRLATGAGHASGSTVLPGAAVASSSAIAGAHLHVREGHGRVKADKP